MKKTLLLLLALPLFFGACKKDKEDDSDNGLSGTVWVYREYEDETISYESTIEFGNKDFTNYTFRITDGKMVEFNDYGTYTYQEPYVVAKGLKVVLRATISDNEMIVEGSGGLTYLKQ